MQTGLAEPILGMTPERIFRHFWEAPYRPLFLASYLWAFTVIAVWPLGERLGLPAPLFTPAVLWHVHELVFGFSSAAIAGYLLTALPNWTNSPPEQGIVLKVLLVLWVMARMSIAVGDIVPVLALVAFNIPFFLLLSGLILVRTTRAMAWRKSLFGIAILLIGAADSAFLLTLKGGLYNAGMDIIHNMLTALALLILIVGSRIIPAYTNNFLNRTGDKGPRADRALGSRTLAISALAAALAAALLGMDRLSSVLMVCAGVMAAWNMRNWRTVAILRNPLLAGLHMAYLWLPLGLVTLGILRAFDLDYPISAALHILGIGAMSGLIIAVSGRAASHTGNGDMQASLFLASGMVFIWIATPVRFIAPMRAEWTELLIAVAAGLWCLGWALCIIGFRPALVGTAARPVLSGAKHEPMTRDRHEN